MEKEKEERKREKRKLYGILNSIGFLLTEVP